MNVENVNRQQQIISRAIERGSITAEALALLNLSSVQAGDDPSAEGISLEDMTATG